MVEVYLQNDMGWGKWVKGDTYIYLKQIGWLLKEAVNRSTNERLHQ